MSAPDELAAWLRLTLIPGIGGEGQRRLLQAFGDPAAIFSASPGALRAATGGVLAEQLLAHDAGRQVAAGLDWASRPGNRILTLADAGYPQALLTAADPPVLLYAKGDIGRLNRPAPVDHLQRRRIGQADPFPQMADDLIRQQDHRGPVLLGQVKGPNGEAIGLFAIASFDCIENLIDKVGFQPVILVERAIDCFNRGEIRIGFGSHRPPFAADCYDRAPPTPTKRKCNLLLAGLAYCERKVQQKDSPDGRNPHHAPFDRRRRDQAAP